MMMVKTQEHGPVKVFQWENGKKFSEIEEKMLRIAWADDKLFIAGVLVYPLEEVVFYCALLEGISTMLISNTLFVPADWVERNCPNLRETIRLIRERAETVRHDT